MMRPRTIDPKALPPRMIVPAMLVILLPAVLNGFPLVYADTGTYLSSGMVPGIPADRPVTYGLFLRITTLNGLTLWGPVVVQALLAAVLLHRTWGAFTGDRSPLRFLASVTVLSMFSGLGWHAGRLMPDIFTPLAVLALLLLAHGRSTPGWRLFDAGVIAFATAVHFGNGPALLLILLLLLLLHTRSPERSSIRRGVLTAALAMVVGVASVVLVNWRVDGRPYFSRGTHVFLLGRTLDIGLLPDWLARHCAEQDNYLCPDHGPLPAHGNELLWSPDGPVQRNGGWDAVRPESEAVLRDVFAEPRSWAWFLGAGVRDAFRQLGYWDLGREMNDPWYREPDSSPYRAIALYFPSELPGYLDSRQVAGTLPMGLSGHMYQVLLGLSLVTLVVLLVHGGQDQRLLLVMVLGSVVIAAGVCAALAMPDQRFLARVSWLMPWGVMLVVGRGSLLSSTR
ncbi:MAG: hypothetical protein H6594_10915 [Flavobacteriales bacterium]|nr:hypothetical protein [Flavobacteriales bacterium]